ncbi:nuclear transport factor 2 family protein [Duganella sp. BuS-21]|uniref:nuclear transport factor 2 family protein n=1 Tax=Duganella sp. BuS-21 TaxID=2943848 RepID=UPI0035A5E255
MKRFIAITQISALFACSLIPALMAANANAQAPASNREIMRAFVTTAYENKQPRAAYEAYVAADLIQHNPNVADGREAAIADLTALFKDPSARFDIKHVLVDGDLAVVHFKGTLSTGAPSAAVFELFRLKDGKIVEHWDAFQVVNPANAQNPHPYF